MSFFRWAVITPLAPRGPTGRRGDKWAVAHASVQRASRASGQWWWYAESRARFEGGQGRLLTRGCWMAPARGPYGRRGATAYGFSSGDSRTDRKTICRGQGAYAGPPGGGRLGTASARARGGPPAAAEPGDGRGGARAPGNLGGGDLVPRCSVWAARRVSRRWLFAFPVARGTPLPTGAAVPLCPFPGNLPDLHHLIHVGHPSLALGCSATTHL